MLYLRYGTNHHSENSDTKTEKISYILNVKQVTADC